ncbi:MAG TPA: transposase [Candidatus Obscuribacterales bacterium]
MPEWRAVWQVKYSLYQLLWQRVLLICCGYEDVNDGALLAHDPGLQLSLLRGENGEIVGPASQSTGCRFENKMNAANCYRLAMWLLFAYISQKKPPKTIRLDFDGASIPTYGDQQGSSFRTYYDTAPEYLINEVYCGGAMPSYELGTQRIFAVTS